jgi:hypothetical protein
MPGTGGPKSWPPATPVRRVRQLIRLRREFFLQKICPGVGTVVSRLIRFRQEFFKFVLARWQRWQGGAEAVVLIFGVGLSGGGGGGCRGGGGLPELESKFYYHFNSWPL